MGASAPFALKAGVWFRRGRLFIVSPDSLAQRARCQAETPLIVLFRFLRPALSPLAPPNSGRSKGAVIARVSSSACSICATDVLPPLPSLSHSEITMPFDLVLRGGRGIDPSQKLDAVPDVAFAAGKGVMAGNELNVDPGTDVRDVSGYIVTPGLIDLHTHVYWGGTSSGIAAAEV